jgi:hypothetical protein
VTVVTKSLRIIAVSLLAAVFMAAQATDPATLGPKVGEHVPDFSLRDQNGVTRTLQSTLGPKGAVLIFFRSADW